jgi:hypothetical protein
VPDPENDPEPLVAASAAAVSEKPIVLIENIRSPLESVTRGDQSLFGFLCIVGAIEPRHRLKIARLGSCGFYLCRGTLGKTGVIGFRLRFVEGIGHPAIRAAPRAGEGVTWLQT